MSTDRHLVLQVHMEIDLHSLQSQNVLHVEQVYIVIKKDRLMMTILLFVLQDSIVSKDHHISIHSQTQVTMVLAQLDITVRKVPLIPWSALRVLSLTPLDSETQVSVSTVLRVTTVQEELKL